MAVTGLERANSLLITTGKPVEAKYGPFTDLNTPGLTAARLVAIAQITPNSIRFRGLTVGIFSTSAGGVAGPIVEYWFESGTTDGDLVEKSSGGGDIAVQNFDYTATPPALSSLTTTLEGLDIPTNTAGGGLKATASSGNANIIELNTIFDSQLSPTTTVKPGGVGGIANGTVVSDLTSLTLTQLFNKLLFPTQLPVYTIPTSTLGALSVSPSPALGTAYEPGTLITVTGPCSFKTNDAGDIDGEIIMQQKLGSASFVSVPLAQHGTQTSTSSSPLINQFNLSPSNDNNPVLTYTRSGEPTQYAITAPQIVAGTQQNSATDIYRSTVGYQTGGVLKDSAGVPDTRTPAQRQTNAPQTAVAANLFLSSQRSVLSRYPWYYFYKSAVGGAAAPTESEFITIIEAGTNANLTKNMTASNGTLSLLNYGQGPSNPTYTCIAYPFLPSGGSNFTEKVGFFLDLTNFGPITQIFNPATTSNISPTGATWSNIQYKIHITTDGFPQSGNVSPLQLNLNPSGN